MAGQHGGKRPNRVWIETVRTVTLDPVAPEVLCLGVEDGRIVARGSREELAAWAGRGTAHVRIARGVAYPAFVESHGHLMSLGAQREQLYVGSPPCRFVGDILARVHEEAARTPPGRWVVGVHYDDTLLAEMRPPTADELSRAAPDHPVYLSHMSGHAAVANWRALELAGVGGAVGTPGVMRDSDGRLTGELREGEAMRPVSSLLPRPSVADRMRFLAKGSEACLRVGVASMSDASFGSDDAATSRDMWQAYLAAERSGALTVRSQIFPRVDARHHFPPEWRGPMVDVGPVKLFADGSIQAHTGALRDPYHDRPDLVVAPFWSAQALAETLRDLRREGRQAATHANGDAAIDLVLEAYRRVLGADAKGDHRWRIEHCQTARRDQLEAMRALGVLPSFFIGHVDILGDLFLGPGRGGNISPLRWAEDAGLAFSLHSDAPVSEIDPARAMATAVTRRTSSGAVLGPGQRVSARTALRAYTDRAAFIGFRERAVGSLRLGRFADLVVLSDGIEALERGEPPQVLATFVGGEPRWQSPSVRLEVHPAG